MYFVIYTGYSKLIFTQTLYLPDQISIDWYRRNDINLLRPTFWLVDSQITSIQSFRHMVPKSVSKHISSLILSFKGLQLKLYLKC